MILDEEELLAKKKRQHRLAMLQYYTWSIEIIALLGNSKDAGSAEFFFRELMQGFIGLCQSS